MIRWLKHLFHRHSWVLYTDCSYTYRICQKCGEAEVLLATSLGCPLGAYETYWEPMEICRTNEWKRIG